MSAINTNFLIMIMKMVSLRFVLMDVNAVRMRVVKRGVGSMFI